MGHMLKILSGKDVSVEKVMPKYAEGRMCQQSGVKYVAVAFLVLKRDHIDWYYTAPAIQQLCGLFCLHQK